ncbi:hypothetical protein J3F83DRAFT_734744 [Trichoderma novae-zelandiae]
MAPPTTKTLLLALLHATPSTTTARQPETEGNAPLQASGCTSTLTLTMSRLPTPPYWPQCAWDGTLSVYSSTVTLPRPVDCGGCADVRVTEVPVVHCPARIISASVRVSTPTTTYRTVCSLTPTAEP